MNNFEQNWKERQDAELRKAGFMPEALTEEQRNIIFQPDEAPENYHQDGEITSDQAYHYWIENLKRTGLSGIQINSAVKMNF